MPSSQVTTENVLAALRHFLAGPDPSAWSSDLAAQGALNKDRLQELLQRYDAQRNLRCEDLLETHWYWCFSEEDKERKRDVIQMRAGELRCSCGFGFLQQQDNLYFEGPLASSEDAHE